MAPLRVGSPQRNKHPRDWEHQHHPQQISLTGPMSHSQHHNPFGAGPSRGTYCFFAGCFSGSVRKMWRCSRTLRFFFCIAFAHWFSPIHCHVNLKFGLYFPTNLTLRRCFDVVSLRLHYRLLWANDALLCGGACLRGALLNWWDGMVTLWAIGCALVWWFGLMCDWFH